MSKQSFGEFLIHLLEFYGVECVFGIPGVHTAELYRGLASSPIQHITPRHEQGAGFAADGYARIAGKPGVCFIITGPGVGNIITAMGQAYADSIPMLVISSVNSLDENRQGNGHLHQLPNQSALLEQVAEFSYTITSPAEVQHAMARAFAVFEGGRPRPVHLEIPVDIMNAPVSLSLPSTRPEFSLPQVSLDNLHTMLAMCKAANRPIILAGGGARHAGKEVEEVAMYLNAPVVMTINARGLLSHEHPLAINASASKEPVRQLIENADLVLALGTELGPTDYDMWQDGGIRIKGRMIRVDISQQQMHQNFQADLAVLSDVAVAMESLSTDLCENQPSEIHDGLAHQVSATIKALETEQSSEYAASNKIFDALWEVLPDAIIVGDSTQPVYAGNDFIRIPDTARWFNSATGFGTLGYALPAAIGAKRASSDRPVIAVAGDGGVQFSVAELATAKQIEMPLTLIIWDNSGYKEIRNFMEVKGIEPEGVDIGSPDFALIAKAYGWDVERIKSIPQLQTAVTDGHVKKKNLMLLGVEDLVLTTIS